MLWSPMFSRALGSLAKAQVRVGTKVLNKAISDRRPPVAQGDWISGIAMAPNGMRRYHLYRPPGVLFSERLPLLVMLHGCGQDARSFAVSTRMNQLATRERFFVLYPEQDRRANAHGCWNWFDTRSGLAYAEAAIVMAALDQVCLLYPVDRARVAVAGLSAGASMAALLGTRHPDRFKAVVMHSGIAPGTASSSASALGAMQGYRTPAALPTGSATAAWPPLMVIHGDADTVVSARNAQSAVQVWTDATGARPGPMRVVQRGKRYAMQVTDFKRRGRTVVSLCEVGTLGHAWSGGLAEKPYSDARGPDASKLVWAFASRQFGPVVAG
jgi:poly(hydroxyalkanoate) depolymerase family esterase